MDNRAHHLEVEYIKENKKIYDELNNLWKKPLNEFQIIVM